MSRAAACGPEGGRADTPACRAAIAAGAAVREWDNIRVARIDGRDRERIPDRELCSGGLSAYRGLDLPRTDWPATTLTAGARHTFRYRTTIHAQGHVPVLRQHRLVHPDPPADLGRPGGEAVPDGHRPADPGRRLPDAGAAPAHQDTYYCFLLLTHG